MTKRKAKAKAKRPTPKANPSSLVDDSPGAVVTVNRVTCDGNMPGGFRVDAVPVKPMEKI